MWMSIEVRSQMPGEQNQKKNFKSPPWKKIFYLYFCRHHLISSYLEVKNILNPNFFSFILRFFIKPWSFLSYIIVMQFNYGPYRIRNACIPYVKEHISVLMKIIFLQFYKEAINYFSSGKRCISVLVLFLI